MESNKKRNIVVMVLCLVCFCAGVSVPVLYSNLASTKADSKTEKIKKILEKDWYYADQVEDLDTLLNEQAIHGMTTLEIDPHTNYFDLEQAKAFSSSLQGTNKGIGIQFYKQSDGNLFVRYVFVNSAADKAGLKTGDVITKVGTLACANKESDEIIQYIKDHSDKSISVDYVRDERAFTMDLIPSEYDATVICQLHEGYGEIILNSFSAHSGQDVAVAMARLKKAGISKMILDLRNNTGGYLSAAIEIASTFLPKDSIVFYEEDKDGNVKEIKTDDSFGQISMDQIIVLQNGNTASASEALIGALKAELKDRVILVGDTTYGKGTEQTSVPFADGTSLKYTIARWLTPDKEWINEKGFVPDVPVKDTSIGSTSYIKMEKKDVIIADTAHENAAAMQQFLQYLGYDVDRVDAYFSKHNSDVLKQFQKEHHLAPTGNCDYKTWDILLEKALEKYNQNSVSEDVVRNKAIELIKG